MPKVSGPLQFQSQIATDRQPLVRKASAKFEIPTGIFVYQIGILSTMNCGLKYTKIIPVLLALITSR